MHTIIFFHALKYYVVANNRTETMTGQSRTQVSEEYKCPNASFQISTSIILLVTLPLSLLLLHVSGITYTVKYYPNTV